MQGVFSLGRWGLLVNVLAVSWSIVMIVNIGWPRPRYAWYEQYGAILFTLALVAIGGGYYWLVQRHKTGVLPEHRARLG